jgi:hypothetical protein
MRQQNEHLQQQLAREAKQRIDMQLDAAIPNWREINQNPAWLQWLQQVDALNGRTRQELLNAANAAGNATRVIAFFKGFLSEAWGAGQGGAQPRPARTDKPIYTRAQIAAPYSAHRRGAYRGRRGRVGTTGCRYHRGRPRGAHPRGRAGQKMNYRSDCTPAV